MKKTLMKMGWVVAAALGMGCGPSFQAPAQDAASPRASEEGSVESSLGRANGAVAHLRRWRWQDVMNNMQALKDMGFTALLLSPHTATCGGDFSDGYDPSEFQNFNSRFGDESQLWWLVQTAHHFGVQVYADMVMNHMCASNYQYTRFGWNDFHHHGGIQNWNDPWWRENGDLFGLNDLAHESSYVRAELFNFLAKTNSFGMDGYRLDAAKHVPLWYWKEHVAHNVNSWGKLAFGEVYDANLELLQQYVDAGLRVTDYSLYDAIQSAFRFGGDLSRLDGAGYAARNGAGAMTFIENHDVGAPPNRSLALAFIAAYPGYPIYYDVWLGDSELTNLVWIHKYLAHGAYRLRHKERDVLVFERDNHLLAAFNQTGQWVSRWVDSPWRGTRLHDFSGHSADSWTQPDGRFEVWIPPMSYVMYAP